MLIYSESAEQCSSRQTALCPGRYAENRDLVNQNSETIRHQAETIEGLTAQLGKQQGPAGKGSKADRSRIKELEEDNESLKVCQPCTTLYLQTPFCNVGVCRGTQFILHLRATGGAAMLCRIA